MFRPGETDAFVKLIDALLCSGFEIDESEFTYLMQPVLMFDVCYLFEFLGMLELSTDCNGSEINRRYYYCEGSRISSEWTLPSSKLLPQGQWRE